MMEEEKIYQFNEYVLGYDKGLKGRSCLTISKIQNGNMYVMSSLYDGSADVISMMLNSLQKELKQKDNIIKEVREILKNIKPLNEKETDIKEMLKEAYIEDNIKGLEINFKTICHLEDFEIAIWNIKDVLDKGDKE